MSQSRFDVDKCRRNVEHSRTNLEFVIQKLEETVGALHAMSEDCLPPAAKLEISNFERIAKRGRVALLQN
jgi:hypothetical protein